MTALCEEMEWGKVWQMPGVDYNLYRHYCVISVFFAVRGGCRPRPSPNLGYSWYGRPYGHTVASMPKAERTRAICARPIHARSLSESRMIKLLILAANPRDTDPLRLGQEVRMIESRIRSSSGASRFDIRSAWAVTADELMYQLNSFKPNIVHFVGHGAHGRRDRPRRRVGCRTSAGSLPRGSRGGLRELQAVAAGCSAQRLLLGRPGAIPGRAGRCGDRHAGCDRRRRGHRVLRESVPGYRLRPHSPGCV